MNNKYVLALVFVMPALAAEKRVPLDSDWDRRQALEMLQAYREAHAYRGKSDDRQAYLQFIKALRAGTSEEVQALARPSFVEQECDVKDMGQEPAGVCQHSTPLGVALERYGRDHDRKTFENMVGILKDNGLNPNSPVGYRAGIWPEEFTKESALKRAWRIDCRTVQFLQSLGMKTPRDEVNQLFKYTPSGERMRLRACLIMGRAKALFNR